jgi:hypothetical protein
MPDLPAPRCHLPEAGRAKILAVRRHHRRALRATVPFERPDAELIFEGHRDALLQFLRAHQHVLERAKTLRRAAPHVALEESRRRNHERHLVFLHQLANHLGIQRIGMKHYARALTVLG